MKCPKCGSDKVQKRGNKSGNQRYQCKNCSGYFSSKVTKQEIVVNNDQPKILIFDIEYSPMEVYTFGLYDQNISIDAIKRDSFMICWSAKWLFEPKIMSDCLTSKEAKNSDDERIVKSLYELVNQCDILVSHNGIKYDESKLKSRILFHALLPLKQYFSIDTLRIARSTFGFTSNKLDYLCKHLGLNTGKRDHEGLNLWIRCIGGDKKALDEMDLYCQTDVSILEDLYLRLRPYIKNHPNLGLFKEVESQVCPNCGRESLKEFGFYYSPNGKYTSYKCVNCYSIHRGKSNLLSKDKKKSLVS